MMSNTSSTAYENGLQQHNLTSAIDYLSQNGATTLAAYPSVTATENGLILDKQTTAAFFADTANPTKFFSTQLIGQAPNTILITNNFGPDESSTISGVNTNFSNSSIRIVTHNNNNNNSNHTNNNIHKNTKPVILEAVNCNMSSDKQQYHHLHPLHHQPPPVAAQPSTSHPNPVKIPNSSVTSQAPLPTTTSTVVLDRINICINNHYGDPTILSSAASPKIGAVSSPNIPPIIISQQTTINDTVAKCLPKVKLTDSSNFDMHIDEPDSTTSTHCHSDLVSMETDHNNQEIEKCDEFDIFSRCKFEIGEDALVKRRDGRYYLGTVVDIHRQQYLIQFDDKTDYWSNVDELMKLSTAVVKKETPTCLACKRENDDDIVEICERCGRGYHRQCSDEVSPKSGIWMCKRCEKPMKYSLEVDSEESLRLNKIKQAVWNKQFPYALDSLTWDEKHRVNLEQIYCYCGKSGQFDNNMIQCCKCRQWFHAHCVECVKTLFRGDIFFIFGCSVCNNGKEFLRRIEMKWADLVHLALYNMAIMKNFQKYHHLQKEIYPYVLERRAAFQLPSKMLNLTDNLFKANLLKTLQSFPKLFQCGKEIKKDLAFWGLRSNKPPQGPTYNVQPDEVLCNQMIQEKLKIKIIPCVEEEEIPKESIKNSPPTVLSKDDELVKLEKKEDEDDKFTSDDEIPIKLILEKVKTSNSTTDLREPKPMEAEYQNDSILNGQSDDQRKDDNVKKEKKEEDSPVKKLQQKSSRKRKAFTVSKGYKDSEKSNDFTHSVCDSSSDENSSSSRGTLDLIIPPPKNFLGINNPFRIISPKKSDKAASSKNSCITKKTVSFGHNSIFTNPLDLNSKIAALKSSGLFPNISNSDIAKAAGQPRLVRTIKRRLSAKDIMIGPNQEVRRRRTRPLPSNVEVISTTTINHIPSNFFPIRVTMPELIDTVNSSKTVTLSSQPNQPHISSSTSSSLDSVPSATLTIHGRRLRKRPEKTSPQNSRRNSICSSSSSNSSTGVATQLSLPPPCQPQNAVPMSDLKQSVNKYFGSVNRIENGEKFTIRAKRRLTSGQTQYLIEWES